MKKTLTIAAIAATMGTLSASAQDLVAAWDTFDSTAASTSTFTATGITATMAQTSMSNVATEDRGASSDTTWGSFDGNGTAASSAIVGTGMNLVSFNGSDGSFTITLTNGSGSDIDLGAFHFDALAFRPNTARDFSLNVQAGGAITAGNVFTSATDAITSLGTAPNAAQDQHDEYDLDLTSLADNTLEAAGTVTFELSFTGGLDGSAGHHLWVDNVALSTAAVVPEPSTYALLGGLFALSFVAMRRRK